MLVWWAPGQTLERKRQRARAQPLLIRDRAKNSTQCVVPCVASSILDVLFEAQREDRGAVKGAGRSAHHSVSSIEFLTRKKAIWSRSLVGVTKALDTVLRESCLWCQKDDA